MSEQIGEMLRENDPGPRAGDLPAGVADVTARLELFKADNVRLTGVKGHRGTRQKFKKYRNVCFALFRRVRGLFRSSGVALRR
jgi:hypothetical protein